MRRFAIAPYEVFRQTQACTPRLRDPIDKNNRKQWTAKPIALATTADCLGIVLTLSWHRLGRRASDLRRADAAGSGFARPFPAHAHKRVVGPRAPRGDQTIALGVDVGGCVAGVHP